MKIRDRKLRANVEVADRLCPQRDCYWPRPDPGRFTQGKGYSNAVAGRWLCGTREIHGCPHPLRCTNPTGRDGGPCSTELISLSTKCYNCGSSDYIEPTEDQP
jgi:hypothetical protein